MKSSIKLVVILMLSILICLFFSAKSYALSFDKIIKNTESNLISAFNVEELESKVGADGKIKVTVERAHEGEWTKEETLTFKYTSEKPIKIITFMKDETEEILDKVEPTDEINSGVKTEIVKENGKYKFIVEDIEGSKYTYTVTVSNIGEAEPTGTPSIEVTYSTNTQTWTKEEILTIKVTDENGIKEVTAGEDASEERTKLSTSENEGTEKTYTYKITKNDTKYAIVATNIKGGKKTYRVTLHNIDNIPPTDEAPTVVKGSSSKKIKVTCNQKDNESGIAEKTVRVFRGDTQIKDWSTISGEIELPSENEEYTIETKAVDRAGNETISKTTNYKTSTVEPTPTTSPSPTTTPSPSPTTTEEPSPSPTNSEITSEKYNIRQEEKIITRVSPGTTLQEFINNISVKGAYTIIDENNNGVTEGNVKTGYKVKTANTTYIISVIGDIAPNGKVDVADLARIRAHLVGESGKILTGVNLFAADISGEGNINIIDLARIRAIIVGALKV